MIESAEQAQEPGCRAAQTSTRHSPKRAALVFLQLWDNSRPNPSGNFSTFTCSLRASPEALVAAGRKVIVIGIEYSVGCQSITELARCLLSVVL